jgi:hypothetical protein
VATGASTGAELEASARKMVEHRNPLRHLRWVVDLRQRVENARTQVDAFGSVGQVAEHNIVGREV